MIGYLAPYIVYRFENGSLQRITCGAQLKRNTVSINVVTYDDGPSEPMATELRLRRTLKRSNRIGIAVYRYPSSTEYIYKQTGSHTNMKALSDSIQQAIESVL